MNKCTYQRTYARAHACRTHTRVRALTYTTHTQVSTVLKCDTIVIHTRHMTLTVILACISYFFPFLPTNLQLSSSTLADIIWNLSWLLGKTDSSVLISCLRVFRQAICRCDVSGGTALIRIYRQYRSVRKKNTDEIPELRERHDNPFDYPTKWRLRLEHFG